MQRPLSATTSKLTASKRLEIVDELNPNGTAVGARSVLAAFQPKERFRAKRCTTGLMKAAAQHLGAALRLVAMTYLPERSHGDQRYR